jgi:hypothetical protein
MEKRWTLALSWGPTGGVYAHMGYCKRLCLGRLALTFCPNVEVDDMMETYVESTVPLSAVQTAGRGPTPN